MFYQKLTVFFCDMMNGYLTKESLVCFIEGRGQLCASNGPDNLHDTWISWVFQGYLPCKQAHYIAVTALWSLHMD